MRVSRESGVFPEGVWPSELVLQLASSSEYERREAYQKLLSLDPEALEPYLCAAVGPDNQKATRLATINFACVSGVCGRSDFTDSIVRYVHDPDPDIQIAIIRALGEQNRKSSQVERALVMLVEDSSTPKQVRDVAILRMAGLGMAPDTVIPQLVDLVSEGGGSPSRWTPHDLSSIRALAKYGERAAGPAAALLSVIVSSDQEPRDRREAACEALIEIGEAARRLASPILVAQLTSQDGLAARLAGDVLARIGVSHQQFHHILGALNYQDPETGMVLDGVSPGGIFSDVIVFSIHDSVIKALWRVLPELSERERELLVSTLREVQSRPLVDDPEGQEIIKEWRSVWRIASAPDHTFRGRGAREKTAALREHKRQAAKKLERPPKLTSHLGRQAAEMLLRELGE